MPRPAVLITGGHGYLGRVLNNLLRQNGHDTFICDLQCRDGDLRNGIVPVWDVADLTSGVPLPELKAIVHLASVSRTGDNIDLMQRHPFETAQLIRWAKGTPIIFASTGSVYGHSEGVCTEHIQPSPVCEYGRMKLESERLVCQAGGVALRMGTLCGQSPNMRWDLVVNAMTRAALSSARTISVWAPGNWRSHVSVYDAARAYLHAIDNYELMRGMMYNVVAASFTMIELARSVAEQCDSPAIEVRESSDDARSYQAVSDKLTKTGFAYADPSLAHAINGLRAELAKLT